MFFFHATLPILRFALNVDSLKKTLSMTCPTVTTPPTMAQTDVKKWKNEPLFSRRVTRIGDKSYLIIILIIKTQYININYIYKLISIIPYMNSGNTSNPEVKRCKVICN